MRRYVDLSTAVTTGHFRWPVERRLLKSHDTGEGQGTWAGWNLHAFTHMDSPRHVDPQGFTTDSINLDMTVGEAAILDLSDVPENTEISGERIAASARHLKRGDIAILKTQWDKRYSVNTPDYWAKAPWMSADAAIFLREAGIKAVGFDFPQDHCIRYFITKQKRPPLPEHVTHFHLLKQGVIMFEYLCNTGARVQPRSFVVALPVKVPDSDGAPARVIAIEGDAP